jgi:hypothetical protein
MSIDRRLANLGIFLLILGAIPLAVSQGWIALETISRAWELWPLILIGIGIGLILRRTPLHFVGGLLVAATFGTMFGALLAGGLNLGALGCGTAAAATDPAILDEHGTFETGTATVELNATCASLAVGPAPGAAWAVTVNGPAGGRPALEQAADRLGVRSPNRNVTIPFDIGRRARWTVTLGTDVTYSLDVNLNAGEATVDLAGLRISTLAAQGNAIGNSRLLLHDATVGRLQVQVNAGDLRIALPAGSDLNGQVQANAASVSLCADPGTGLRLRSTSTLTGDNFAAAGLVRSGTTWESPGIGSATHVVDLALEGAAASFTLNPSEGCR